MSFSKFFKLNKTKPPDESSELQTLKLRLFAPNLPGQGTEAGLARWLTAEDFCGSG